MSDTRRPVSPSTTHRAELIASLTGHTGDVGVLAFSPDRSLLASAGQGETGYVWDLTVYPFTHRARFRKSATHPRAVAFSPDSRTLVAGLRSGALSVCDLGLVGTWQVEAIFRSMSPVASVSDVSAKLAAEIQSLRGGARSVQAVAFSPDGKWVGATGEDRVFRIWEVGGASSDARTLLHGHTQPVRAVQFSPDGHGAATGGQDATACVWVLERIRPHLRMVLPHHGTVHALTYTPDGHMLVTGGDDPVVRVWDVTALKPSVRVEFPSHAGGTRQVLVTPDGNTLVTAGRDHRVARWNLRTGTLQSLWEIPAGGDSSFAITRDGRYLARGTAVGGIEMYRVAESRG